MTPRLVATSSQGPVSERSRLKMALLQLSDFVEFLYQCDQAPTIQSSAGCEVMSTPVGEVLLVGLGRRSQLGVGLEFWLELCPRRLAFGGDVFGRPVGVLVRPVVLEHAAGDGGFVDLVDAVDDAHRWCGRVDRLQWGEVGRSQ